MNFNRLFRSPAGLLAVMGLLLAVPGSARAQTGSVIGRVVDARTMAPISSAQVVVVGTQIGSLTASDGTYRIPNVQPGSRELRVITIGYRSETLTVDVVAGQTSRLDFSLAVSAVALDEIIVTGTAGRQDRRAQAASVSSVNASQVAQVAPVTSVATLLQARTTGVSITTGSGTSGGTQRIRLRGSASIELSNEPLLIIDGVRADSRSQQIYGVGGQSGSRFNDINPDDIESIEIVKGPAAATLYGADASAGVIQIRTKRGQAGAGFTQTISYEYGQLEETWTPPSNWAECRESDVTNPDRTLCYNQSPGTLVSDNPLLRYDVFQNGINHTLNWTGRGGGQNYGYFLSFGANKEQGTLPNNEYNRYTGRVNFDFTPQENLKLEWSMGLARIDQDLPNNDNNIYGYLGGALLGSPRSVGLANDGWYATNRQTDAISHLENRNMVFRVTPVFTINYTPRPWFRNRLNAGVDMTRAEATSFYPKNDIGWYGTATLNSGQISQARENRDEVSIDYLGSVRWSFLTDMVADLAFGGQAIARRTDRTNATGQGLTTNSANSINAAATTTGGQQYTEEREGGIFSQLDLAWRDRLYLQVGARVDKNSAFGEEAQAFFNPKVGLSYVISEEDFFPDALRSVFSTLRLRTVWGSTGRSPNSGASLTTFDSSPYAITSTDVRSGVIPRNPGNAELKPERGKETELGFDAGLFNERIGLEVTYYNKVSSDLILERPLPPSLGFSNDPLVNIGELKNSGWEISAHSTVYQTDDFSWDARANVSTNHNEVTDLGDVEPFGSNNRVLPGYPAYGYWTRRVDQYDIANDQAIVTDTAVFIGNPNPGMEGNLNSTFSFFNAFRVYAQFDFMKDYIVYNNTDQFRERQFGTGERWIRRDEILSPEERLGRFGPFVGHDGTAYNASAVNEQYYQKGDHVRFRELSVSYTLPGDVSQRFGASSATLTMGARNLALWTDYQGADPEVTNGLSSNEPFTRSDFLTLPQTRRWLVRMNVTF